MRDEREDAWGEAQAVEDDRDLRLEEHPHRPPMVVERERPARFTSAGLHDDLDPVAREIEVGKTLAILSHASVLFGLPVFLIPMFTRDNRFALHHAKAAAVTFTIFWVAASLTLYSCGVFFPVMMVAYLPALVGVVQAANGRLAGRWGFGELGERIFASLTAR